jgi:hypothetical protein
MQCSPILGTLAGVLFAASTAAAQVPEGWLKVSGVPETGVYSGVPDGLKPVTGDRENSYAWSMDVLGDYLYVGTNRNAFSLMINVGPVPRTDLLDLNRDGSRPVPVPQGFGARLFRMGLASGEWEAVAVPPGAGEDTGFRMMRTFAAAGRPPVLYVGGSGVGWCRLLAVDATNTPKEIFSSVVPGRFLSIRSIAEHDGQLFWATEDAQGPAVFVSPDPMNRAPERIPLPAKWQQGGGAEIADMVGYNGSLYVFFLTKTQDETKFGFWVAKVKKTRGAWRWTLMVGDKSVDDSARYSAGMGNPENGVAVPFRFRNHVYVGTMDAAAFRLLNGINQPPQGAVPKVWGKWGMEIWRFNQRDEWERVMPSVVPQSNGEEALRGFGNPNNKYMWRFGAVDGRLYVGTFDVSTGFALLMSRPPYQPAPLDPTKGYGFDLYSTSDGVTWRQESVNGFLDPWNYGVRSFATDPVTGDLFLGTANPFYGCQVWRKRATSK